MGSAADLLKLIVLLSFIVHIKCHQISRDNVICVSDDFKTRIMSTHVDIEINIIIAMST